MNKLLSIYNNENKKYAFIDETGNCSLEVDKDGVSSHFIITAIIVDSSKLEVLEKEVDGIREKYFGRGEIKSNSIGKNYIRRKQILEELKDLNFHHYSVIVDKRKVIKESGLKYKKSFLKYLNSLLHKQLKMYYPKLQLVSDQHGTKEFMDGFVKYVNSKSIPNMFEEYEFGFDNSKENVLIQLADLFAGTLSFKYEECKDNDQFNNFKQFLDEKCLDYVEWPFGYDNYLYEYEKDVSNKYDSVIYKNSIFVAVKYIKENENKEDMEVKDRVIVLKYLLTMLLIKEKSRYVTSKELINNLKLFTGRDYTSQYFKTSIIAKLRDARVLISSSNKGYKIPECEKDIYAFVNQTSQMIMPMVDRLGKARNRILVATNNELDILDKPEYTYLKEIVEKM